MGLFCGECEGQTPVGASVKAQHKQICFDFGFCCQ